MASDFIHTRTALKKSKIPAAIMVVAFALAIYPAAMTHIEESRAYRNVMNLTPFKDVDIHKVVVDGDTMTVWGSFEKVRCGKVAHHAYTRGDEGYNHHAQFSSADESFLTPENRPKTGHPEFFGPWKITSSIPNPARASFYPVHRCDGIIESNLFFDLPWEDYERD